MEQLRVVKRFYKGSKQIIKVVQQVGSGGISLHLSDQGGNNLPTNIVSKRMGASEQKSGSNHEGNLQNGSRNVQIR
jgi:hypothetical protein